MPIPLSNDRWGHESSCFVCEKSNQHGLQIPFQLDDGGETVSAPFSLGYAHSGAPALVHGGLSLAILDEAQAWAVIAIANKWGLTKSVQASFDGAVLIDSPHRVQARIVNVSDSEVTTEASILDQHNAAVVHCATTFFVIGIVDEAQAALGLLEPYRDLLGPELDAT